MNLNNIPQPDARELPADLGWQLWDMAVQEQDTGFLSLEPDEQEVMRAKLSERSAFRAEVVL